MNRWIRRVVYLVIIGLVWVVVSEIVRYQARAELEEEMRANFEVLQCPQDQIEGDVCLAYPDEGRCLTGEYIDYRTVWGRVVNETQIEAVIDAELGKAAPVRKVANWLACQGFASGNRARPDNVNRLGLYTGGPALFSQWENERCTLGVSLRMHSGFGPVSQSHIASPINLLFVRRVGGICFAKDHESGLLFVRALGFRNLFAK